MKKLLIATTAFFMASQANAVIYGITYTFEREAVANVASQAYYLWSRELVTATPDPTHIYYSPPSVTIHAGGATPILGTGTLNTATGEIVLNGINIEMVIPSTSLGYFGYRQTLQGSFSGNTYIQTSNSVSWAGYVCEVGFETSGACLSGVTDVGRVDPDGIVFDYLGLGGTGSFFQRDAVFPNIETRMNFEIVTPIPAATWLFGSALLGLVGVGRYHD